MRRILSIILILRVWPVGCKGLSAGICAATDLRHYDEAEEAVG